MTQNKFPPGWDEKKVRKLIEYYDSQTDEEVAAELDEVAEPIQSWKCLPSLYLLFEA